MRHSALILIAGASVGCASTSFTVAGDVAADGRLFFQAPKYAGQDQGTTVSLVAEPSFQLDSLDKQHRFRLDPFYRLDPSDERRSHFDVRESSYRFNAKTFELTAGISTVSWGVLESHRPVDVINQHDFVESLNETAKLGQPMLEVGWVGDTMSVKAYVLPSFRERTFPGARGRLRFPASIDVEQPQFESALGRWHPSGALRWATSVGELDLGVSLFTGTSREPRFIVEFSTGQVVPRYELMQQGSIDAQLTHGPITLKAEFFARLATASFSPFFGGGAGLDYTFFDIGHAGVDLAVALEFFLDSRPAQAPVTFFDHDGFVGLRVGFNDSASTEMTLGAVFDIIDGSTLGRIDASRRLGEHFRASLVGLVFLGASGSLQSSFSRDSNVQARLAYFF